MEESGSIALAESEESDDSMASTFRRRVGQCFMADILDLEDRNADDAAKADDKPPPAADVAGGSGLWPEKEVADPFETPAAREIAKRVLDAPITIASDQAAKKLEALRLKLKKEEVYLAQQHQALEAQRLPPRSEFRRQSTAQIVRKVARDLSNWRRLNPDFDPTAPDAPGRASGMEGMKHCLDGNGDYVFNTPLDNVYDEG